MSFEKIVEEQKELIKESVKAKFETQLNEGRQYFSVFVKEGSMWHHHIDLDDKYDTQEEVDSLSHQYRANQIKVVKVDKLQNYSRLGHAGIQKFVEESPAAKFRGAMR